MSRSTRGRSRSAIAAVTLAAVLCALAGAGADGTADAADPLRIMPLGDSITEGHQIPGGYRIDLEDDLLAAGIAFNFVGSLQNGPAALADKEHEGHSGWRIDQLHASVGGWLTTHQPDVVLLLIGTNDVRQDYQLSTAPSRLAALVDQIHTSRPATKILLSSIPPFADATDDTQAAAYNAAIPEIVDTRVAQGRPISFVDAGRRLTLGQLADGVHPNASGYSSLADSWLAAIQAAAGGNAPPTVALTAPPDGASYAAGTAVALQASASDGDGQVTRVEFFAGQTKLGEDQSDPYQLSWASPPAGSHQLSARATDNQGATTTSTTRTITIAAAGERTLYRAINLGGPALTIDGRPWESGTAANVSAGPTVYENQSIALEPPTDSERARMIRSVVWGSSLTTVRLSAVPTGNYEVYLTVWEDNNSSTIDIRLDGVLVRAGYPTGSGGHWERLGPWPLGVSDGTLDLTAGPDANLSGIEVWHVASGGPGNVPPTVALTAPPDGASYAAGTAVALQASASDGDGQVTRVEFFAGQTKLGEDQSDPYQLSWASPPAGSHQLSARATDNQDATTTSATRTITVAAANTAPTAVAKTASTRTGTAAEILLEGSDSETCELTFEVTGPPSHGTLGPLVALPCSTGTPHRDGGRVTYTPTPGYVGQDAFTYRVLDGNLASAPVSVGITVEPAPSPSTISVADLDGAPTNRGKTWSASVTVSVVDGTGAPLSGVDVAGSWSSGAGASCTTGTNGSCVVTLSEIAKRTASVRLGVSRLTKASYTYDATLNRDPDGDSDGTTITVGKP